MKNSYVAQQADVHPGDVSNFVAKRFKYLSDEKFNRICSVIYKSKVDHVIDWLETGQTLTALQSLEYFGLMSLSQTVTKLRKRGYEIENLTPNGSYATYSLKAREQS